VILVGTCPAGPSWGSLATNPTSAHARAECSDAGICDRATGQCKCFAGYEGDACQRSAFGRLSVAITRMGKVI
jgi:hypothetical protein